MQSSRSRITLVGYDTELEAKPSASYDTKVTKKESGRLDSLLAVFCIRRRRNVVWSGPAETEDRDVYLNSPWVLPVYVLSAERDTTRHLKPKEAKCTIDTGNLQGNIVSRAFVVDVLGYPESSFQKLTKLEEDGGTGVTGHRLVPQGAIALTWYHNASTRVFRDMRFLVSENPMYDLIVGARSIQENNILDVPNLMGGQTIFNELQLSEKEEDLVTQMINANKTIADLQVKKRKEERKDKNSTATKEVTEKLQKEEEQLAIANMKLEILQEENKTGEEAVEKRKSLVQAYPKAVLQPFGKAKPE